MKPFLAIPITLLVSSVAATACMAPEDDHPELTAVVDADPGDSPDAVETFPVALAPCTGAVDDVAYYYPLRQGAELLDISYMDVPNGLPEYPGGGVMYDYHRDNEGSSYDDNISHTPGFRDYMGNNTTYDEHNGSDNSITPPRVIAEGGGLVYATAPGVVTEVIHHYPNADQALVRVKHANGYMSRYWHLRDGGVRVRVGDDVDTSTVLAELETGGAHLHWELHDCDPAGDEPSYFEIYRADKHLMARKPIYETNPSDASDISLWIGSDPGGFTSDVYRVRRGESLHARATGQWRTTDTIQVDFKDPVGAIHGASWANRTDLDRAIWFAQLTSYTIGASDPLGVWQARTTVNGRVRDVKYFTVAAAGSVPNANGPVQSAVAVVSSGSDNVHAYYRGTDGHMFSYRWRERFGWDFSNHLGDLLAGAPSCVQRSATLVDCFYRNTLDGHLHRWASVDGGMNGTISDIHGAISGDPAAFSTGPSSLEVSINDGGTMSLLHFTGSAFTTTTSGTGVAQAPACVVADPTHWLCYARTAIQTVNEIRVVDGAVTAAVLLGFPAQYDVSANIFPGALDQKHRVVVTTRSGNAFHQNIRIEYTDSPTPQWMTTQDTGIGAGELSVVPRCAARPGTETLECFAADLDHNMIRLPWDGTRWLNWEPVLSSPMDRQAPSLTAMTADRLDLIYAFTPNSSFTGAIQRTQQDNIWSGDLSMDNAIDASYPPGCVARGGTKIDCFFVSAAGSIARRTYAGGVWSAPVAQSTVARSGVSAVATTATTVSIMYFDSLGYMREHALGDSGWSGSSVFVGQPAGTTLIDSPGCTTRFVPFSPLPGVFAAGTTSIDCFARTSDNQLVVITKSGSTWGAWSFVPGAHPRSAPSAVSMGYGNDEVFFRGPDNTLVQMSRQGLWAAPAFLGGALASAPSCVHRSLPTRIDCVGQGFRNLGQDLIEYNWQDSIGWGLPHGLGTGLVNVGLRRPATQSSEYTPNPAAASRAVDGNLDGNFNNGSVTHTGNSGIPWWQVDLGANRWIDHVQVFNRTDCCQSRLDGFTVQVSSNGTTWSTPTGPVVDFARTAPAYPGVFMPVKTTARYVRIQLPSANWLSLAEVMVMARGGS